MDKCCISVLHFIRCGCGGIALLVSHQLLPEVAVTGSYGGHTLLLAGGPGQ